MVLTVRDAAFFALGVLSTFALFYLLAKGGL